METEEKKQSKYWLKIVRAVLAALAAAAIGYGAAKFGLLETPADKQHVEAIQTVVTKTIQGDELTEEEAAKATTGAVVVTGKIISEQQKKSTQATPVETKK